MVRPNLLACLRFLYKVVHNGRLSRLNLAFDRLDNLYETWYTCSSCSWLQNIAWDFLIFFLSLVPCAFLLSFCKMCNAINKKVKFYGAGCPFLTFFCLQGDHHCACSQQWCHFSFFQELSKQIKALRPEMTKMASMASMGFCFKLQHPTEWFDRKHSKYLSK